MSEQMERLKQHREQVAKMTPEQFRQYEYERLRKMVDGRNNEPGELNVDHYNGVQFIPGDGIDCPLCLNRGFKYDIQFDGKSLPQLLYVNCECSPRRIYAKNLLASGLSKAAAKYRFDNFDAVEPWQQAMFDKGKQYVEHGASEGHWFYAGGQSGCGKSHICTAIATELVKSGRLKYIVWPQTVKMLGGLMKDPERYDAELNELQSVKYLFIDDLFKPVFRATGAEALATSMEVKLGYDIINARYNSELTTIITSEWFSHELASIDEATAGRIIEACGEYKVDIARNPERNHRITVNVL